MRYNSFSVGFLAVSVLTLAACGGGSGSGGALLDLNNSAGNNPKVTTAKLAVVGPTEASPGVERTGYRATLTQTDGTTAIPAQPLSFKSDSGGTFNVTNGSAQSVNATTANTNNFGQVQFSYTPANAVTVDKTVKLTVTADNYMDATGNPVTQSVNVTVRADTFKFTAPTFGSSAGVGSNNAKPLRFQWANSPQSGGAAVAGKVCLKTDSTGLLIINNDPTVRSQTQQVMTSVDSGGDFATPVSLFSDSSGFVQVTASDCGNVSRTATVGVQFVDDPCTGDGCVSLDAPVTTPPSPDASGNQRKAKLTVDVRNDAFKPIDGIQVTFTLVNAISSSVNEYVFPGGGTTNASGQATSEYFVPASTGTARVRACVRRSSGENLCRERDIQVKSP